MVGRRNQIKNMKNMKKNMKKIYILLTGLLLITACSEDNSSVTNVNTEIIPDRSLGANSYIYPDLNSTIEVPFRVRGANSVEIYSRKESEEYGLPATVSITNGAANVVFSREELGLLEEGDIAFVKIVANSLEREIMLEMTSSWINIDVLRKQGREKSAITTGITFAPIEGNPTKDTIIFNPSIDSWENIDNAVWDVSYKIGDAGIEKSITPISTKRKDSIVFVKSLQDWGASEKDTVFITAEITNNGITRVGEFSFIVKNISVAINSKTVRNEDFSGIFNSNKVDTLTMSAEITNKYILDWASLKNAKWTFSYSTDVDPTVRSFPGNTSVIVNTDTLAVAKINGTFGKLPNTNACDKVFINGLLEMGDLQYTVTHSYDIVK